MDLKKLIFSGAILTLFVNSFADIVYQGKRVNAWPEGSFTKFDNDRGVKLMRAPSEAYAATSHILHPKGKSTALLFWLIFRTALRR